MILNPYRFGPSSNGNDANTMLLTHLDGTDGSTIITDVSQYAASMAVGGTGGSLATLKTQFGPTSFFTGFNAGGYVYTPASSHYAFTGTGNYTVDFWFSRYQTSGSTCALIGLNGGGVRWLFYWRFSDHVAVYNATSGVFMEGTTQLTPGGWHHFAFVKLGSACSLYLDGGLQASATNTVGSDATPWVHIGDNAAGASASAAGGEASAVFIDEVRISNTARWTSAFTPQTFAYS